MKPGILLTALYLLGAGGTECEAGARLNVLLRHPGNHRRSRFGVWGRSTFKRAPAAYRKPAPAPRHLWLTTMTGILLFILVPVSIISAQPVQNPDNASHFFNQLLDNTSGGPSSATTPPPPSASPPATASGVPAEKGPQENGSPASPLWEGSLMYEAEQIKQMRTALESYKTHVPLEILLPDLFPAIVEEANKDDIPATTATGTTGLPSTEEETKAPPAPVSLPEVFYLNSILYFAPGHWTIWLNHTKLTLQDTFPPLKIVEVKKDKVIFSWPDAPLEKLSPDILSNYNATQRMDPAPILIDDKHTVSFALSPNQTFIFSQMKIIEGPEAASSATDTPPEEGQEKPRATAKKKKASTDPDQASPKTSSPISNIMKKLDVIKDYKKEIEKYEDILENQDTPK